jgi:peptide/nickel transport system permease protein
MFAYLIRRLPSALVVLVLATVPIFGVMRLAPGDPAAILAGPDATPEVLAQTRHDLGLDRPLVEQYFSWLGGVLRWDFATSFVTGAEVSEIVGRSLGNTATLAFCALLVALVLALPLGIAQALAQRGWLQLTLSGLNVVMLAVPPYVTGVILVFVFAITLRLLPPGSYVSLFEDPVAALQFLTLPSLCLALPVAAVLARFLAASLQRTVNEQHYLAAQLRGITGARLLVRHGLPNSLGSVVTILGIQIGNLLGGAVIVEGIFAWPGLGQALVQAAKSSDYPIVQAILLLAVGVFILLQLLSDVVNAAIDPRVRERA